jgi:hypothetical protein
MPLFTRLARPRQRDNLMGPLAMLTCATLILTVLRPGLIASLAIFSASAAFGVYQLAANTAFVVRVPNERRSQAFGIASMAYGRCFTHPRPYKLIDLARAAGLSISGVRIAFTDDEITQAAEILKRPPISDDGPGPAASATAE